MVAELESLLGEIFASLLDLPEQLVVSLVAVTQGEQVPSDVYKGVAAEHHDGVEGEDQHKEEP